MKPIYKKLIKCVILDTIGMASFTLPFIDIFWAPIAASISFKMFGQQKGKYTALFTFLEEVLPFSDIIPSFTIFWLLFDLLRIGKKHTKTSKCSQFEHVAVAH